MASSIEKVILSIDADIEEARKAIEELEGEIENLKSLQKNALSEQAAKEYATAIDAVSERISKLRSSIESMNDARSEMSVSLVSNIEAEKRNVAVIDKSADAASRLSKQISGVRTSLLMVIRDAPYGLLGVMNNIEMLTDQMTRLREATIASGKSFNAFGALTDALKSLLTSPAGIISVVGVLALSLGKQLGSAIDNLTSGAFTRLSYSLENLAERFGLLNRASASFEESFRQRLGDLTSENVNRVLAGVSAAEKVFEREKSLLEKRRALVQNDMKLSTEEKERIIKDIDASIAMFDRLITSTKTMVNPERIKAEALGKMISETIAQESFVTQSKKLEIEAKQALANILRIKNDVTREREMIRTKMYYDLKVLDAKIAEAKRSGRTVDARELAAEKAVKIAEFEREKIEFEKKQALIRNEVRAKELNIEAELLSLAKERMLNVAKESLVISEQEEMKQAALLLNEKELAKKREIFELELARKKINQEQFNEELMRQRFTFEQESQRINFLSKLSEIQPKTVKGVDLKDVIRERQLIAELQIAMLSEQEAKELNAFADNERAKTEILSRYAKARLDIQEEMLQMQLRLYENDREGYIRIQTELAKLRAEREMLLQEDTFSFSKMYRTLYNSIGTSLGELLAMQLFYTNEINRVENERLVEEKRRFAERERMAREEYERSVANINNLLATQQISQAEADERRRQAEEKRASEFEQIKIEETRILERETKKQNRIISEAIKQNLANLAVQMATTFVMSDAGLRLLGVLGVPIALAAIGATATLIRSSLQSQVSFAEGRMFERPTMIGGAIVGDGRKAGAPVNMEVLLNAAQLAEFKVKTAEKNEPIVVNLALEFNASNLVEKFEEQKVIYAKRRI